MCIADIPKDDALMMTAWRGDERMIVIALGETGAKVLDRVVAEWPKSARQVQWICDRIDYRAHAYKACMNAWACMACANFGDCCDSGRCTDLASCTEEGSASREEQDGVPVGMKALTVKEVYFEEFRESEYALILADQDGGCNIPAAAYLAGIAREQGCRTIGVVTAGDPDGGDTFAGETLQEELRPFREAADCLLCLPRTAEQTPESLLWPAARALAVSLAEPGFINLDFEDIRAMFQDNKNAWLGTGSADGADAAEAAVNDLLACTAIKKHLRDARELYLSITCPPDTDPAVMDRVTLPLEDAVGLTASIIWSVNFEETETGRIQITVIAVA